MPKFCSECEDEIPRERLRIVPNTTLCVVCQEDDDVFRTRAVIVQNEEGDNEIGGFINDRDKWERFASYKDKKQK